MPRENDGREAYEPVGGCTPPTVNIEPDVQLSWTTLKRARAWLCALKEWWRG